MDLDSPPAEWELRDVGDVDEWGDVVTPEAWRAYTDSLVPSRPSGVFPASASAMHELEVGHRYSPGCCAVGATLDGAETAAAAERSPLPGPSS